MKIAMVIMALAVLAVASSVLGQGCVDIFFEAPPVVRPGETITISGGITNCGDTPGVAHLEATLTFNGEPLPVTARGAVRLAAGETKPFELTEAVPEETPLGTYELCVTAKLKGATDTECAVVEVVE